MARVTFMNVSTIQIVERGSPELPEIVRGDALGNIQVSRLGWNQIIHLHCENNQLQTLPILPERLTQLECSNNKLTTLPELPLTLEYLHCKNNQLTTLPELPQTLANLWCENNQLQTLPILPKRLTQLECSNNKLTSLPNLAGLDMLEISVYQLMLLQDVHRVDRNRMKMYEVSDLQPFLRPDIVRVTVAVRDEDSYKGLMHQDNMLKKYTSMVDLLIRQLKEHFILECPNFKLLVKNIRDIKITNRAGPEGVPGLNRDTMTHVTGFNGGTCKRYSKNSRKRRKRYSKKSRKYR